ncbi:3,5-dihydroxyphenylacetyl-CoA synthase DpgA [Dyella humi]|uniref:Type III polyketide synthase n=1 Tax=Dyella humi TaxID=1770547 RepID=A0ABW8IEN8_9GAMM
MELKSAILERANGTLGCGIQSVSNRARIASVGTANPETSYSQHELIDLLNIRNERIRSLFLKGAIDRRYLTLPPALEDGSRLPETQADLLKKHRRCAVDMGARAIHECVAGIGAQLRDVGYLCCVTSTGFMAPGISAYLSKELGLAADCTRLDVVGMGCNAGLNGLNAAAAWSVANPSRLALLLCVEVCSAAYVFDDTMRSSVVNSLFGDGAAAAALITQSPDHDAVWGPSIERFQSRLVSSAIEGMRFDWDETHGRFSFYLDPVIPYVVGANAPQLVADLLASSGVRRSAIRHWLVHSGGKKVIDAVKINLGLSSNDLRHTSGVLREFGNLSSGSFLFSYKRLLQEQAPCPGDYGVMLTMGPGTTIESALLRW